MNIYRIGPRGDIASILEELDNSDALALSSVSIHSLEEAQLSEYLSAKAFSNGTNLANKLRYEFLLWLSGRRDIKSAMEDTRPVAGKELFLVVFGKPSAQLKRIITRALPLGLPEDGNQMRIEKISLSRIKG